MGTLLIVIGLLGIALSALGVVQVWRVADDVTVAAREGLLLLSDTLNEIERSLDVASSTLDGTTIAIDSLYITSFVVGETLSRTQVTVDEMASLAEEQLPQSVEYSLTALESVKDTARVIDQLLRSLAQLGLGAYDPEIPLDEAVENAATGLEPVPTSLRVMGAGLDRTSEDLKGVQRGFTLMIDHVMEIRENLNDADAAITAHRTSIQSLQERVESAEHGLAEPIRAVAWGLTLLIIWIGLSQLAILRWGAILWQRRTPSMAQRAEVDPDGRDEMT
jgi:hypothetical protein